MDSNSYAYALGPCSSPSTCRGACCPARPWPWKTFNCLFPVPGQGTPCSHDASDHLECAFPDAPAYASASAQVVLFSHRSRPTSPRSSQALICTAVGSEKALAHLTPPFLSGVFISFSFMHLHLICSIQSAYIFLTCRPAQVEIPCSSLSLALQFSFTRAFPVDHIICRLTMPVSLYCSALARSGLHPCPPQSVRAKIFQPKWMLLQTCMPPFPLVALTFQCSSIANSGPSGLQLCHPQSA